MMPTRRDLWTLRWIYIAWMGGNGFLFPFLNLFLKRQGLDGVEIGWIVAIGSVVALLAAPLWARMSSQSSKPLRLAQLAFFLSGALAVVLSWQSAFVWLALAYSLRVLATAGMPPLMESTVARATEALRLGYGSVRVFGSLGWAVIVLAAGWIIERAGIRTSFYFFCATAWIAALLISRLGPGVHSVAPAQKSGPALSLRQVTRNMLRQPALLGLAITLILITLGNMGVAQFENIYLDQLGASEGLIGVANMVGSVFELPGMLWADRLVRRHGSGRILLAGFIINIALRAAVFAVPSAAAIIATKAVTGISFSFYTIGLVKYISERTAGADTATMMAIFTVTLPSLLNIAGTPLVGLAFDHIGARWLYTFAIVGYLLGSLALGLSQRASQKNELDPA